MKFKKYYEARNHFNAGDIVYACAFKYSHEKEAKALFQKPIRGMLTVHENEAKNNKAIFEGLSDVNYFVPFKKNGTDLAWSKAVKMSSRCYATSEQECNELYNSLIQSNINWHLKEIEDLKANMI